MVLKLTVSVKEVIFFLLLTKKLGEIPIFGTFLAIYYFFLFSLCFTTFSKDFEVRSCFITSL